MHFRPAYLMVPLIALGVVACRKTPAPIPLSPVERVSDAHVAVAPPKEEAPAMCFGRPHCTIERETTTPELGLVRVVDLSLSAEAGAGGCDKREYWRTSPSGSTLLATDCREQVGADEAGPA